MITWVTPTKEAEEYGMIIPLSAVLENGKLSIHAYREAEQAARWLDAQTDLTALTAEVRQTVDRMLRPIVREMGYEPEDGYVQQIGYVYRAERIGQIQSELIRPDTVLYERKNDHVCLTETVLDAESDACLIYATMRGNEVLSFANLNGDDGEVADIGTESARGYEGQGLAASNVAALTLDLLRKGRARVIYVALSDNPASCRVAEKVGFLRAAEEYNYVCFLREED